MKFYLFVIGLVSLLLAHAQDTADFETISCNHIYPFGFNLGQDQADVMKVMDFYVSKYTNDLQWDTSGGEQYQWATDDTPYTAILFNNTNSQGVTEVYAGVTYEVERHFRWLKKLTTASSQIEAGSILIINQTTTHRPTTSQTTTLGDGETDDIIVVTFEISTSELVIAQFDYFTGNVRNAQKVTKKFTAFANKIVSAIVKAAPDFSTGTQERIIHVMTDNTGNVMEIHQSFDGTVGKAFDYSQLNMQSSNAQLNEVLGISTIRFDIATFREQTSLRVFSATLDASGTITCDTDEVFPLDDFVGENFYYNQFAYHTSHYFYGTAFLAKTSSTSNEYEVNWFFAVGTKETFDGTPIQNYRHHSYTFDAVSPLNGQVVSQDAPGACFTAFDSSTGQTKLIFDDIRLTREANWISNQYQDPCGNDPKDMFVVDNDLFKFSVEQRAYDFTAEQYVVRAFSIPSESLHWNNLFNNYQTTSGTIDDLTKCTKSQVVLLQSATETKMVLMYFRYQRRNLIRYNDLTNPELCTTATMDVDNRKFIVDGASYSALVYKVFQFDESFYGTSWYENTFSKAYISNSFSTTNPNRYEVDESKQQFFFALNKDLSNERIHIETNNNNIRQTSVSETSLTDFRPNIAYDHSTAYHVYQEEYSTRFSSLTNTDPTVVSYDIQTDDIILEDSSQNGYVYDWTFNTKPRVMLIDTAINNKYMCMSIDRNANQFFLFKQGVNIRLDGSNKPISNTLNQWPYSNCQDRSRQHSDTLWMGGFFSATIANPTSVPVESQIQIQMNVADTIEQDTMTLNFDPVTDTFGSMDTNLQVQYKIGADSLPHTTLIRYLFLEQCSQLEWAWPGPQSDQYIETINVAFGSQDYTYVQLPNLVLTNNGMVLTNTRNYTGSLNYKVYQVQGEELTEFNDQIKVTSDHQLQIKFLPAAGGQTSQNYTIMVQIDLADQLYFINPDSTESNVYGDFITVRSQPIYVNVFANSAPEFDQANFKNEITVQLDDKLTYKLPGILDPDGDKTSIQSLTVEPSAPFVILFEESGVNKIRISPKSLQDVGTYTIYLLIRDHNIYVPQFTMNLITLKITREQIVAQSQFEFIVQQAKKLVVNDDYRMLLVEMDLDSFIVTFEMNQVTRKFIRGSQSRTVKDNLKLSVTAVPVDQSFNSTDVQWTCLVFNGVDLRIQLQGDIVQNVTLAEQVDYLLFDFNTAIFQNTEFEIPKEAEWSFEEPLIQEESSVILDQGLDDGMIQTTSSAVTGVITFSFFTNIIMAVSLQQLWSMINVMQLLLATPLINILFSPNVYKFCDSLLRVMNFDIYDTDQVNQYLFGDQLHSETLEIEEEERELSRSLAKAKSSSKRASNNDLNLQSSSSKIPLNQKYSLLGYESKNVVYNMGPFLHILVLLICASGLNLVLSALNIFFPTNLGTRLEIFIANQVSLSVWIRIFIEGNFEFIIIACIQLSELQEDNQNWLDSTSKFLAITCLALAILAPLIAYFKIRQLHRTKSLRLPLSMNIYGELYESQLHRGPINFYAVIYNVLYSVRRLVSLSILIYAQEYLVIQLGFYMFLIIGWTAYVINVKPFEDQAQNRIDIFNNVCYWLCLQCCFLMTDNVDANKLRTGSGYTFSSIILLIIAVNSIYMLYTTVRQLFRKLKRYFIRNLTKFIKNWKLVCQSEKKKKSKKVQVKTKNFQSVKVQKKVTFTEVQPQIDLEAQPQKEKEMDITQQEQSLVIDLIDQTMKEEGQINSDDLQKSQTHEKLQMAVDCEEQSIDKFILSDQAESLNNDEKQDVDLIQSPDVLQISLDSASFEKDDNEAPIEDEDGSNQLKNVNFESPKISTIPIKNNYPTAITDQGHVKDQLAAEQGIKSPTQLNENDEQASEYSYYSSEASVEKADIISIRENDESDLSSFIETPKSQILDQTTTLIDGTRQLKTRTHSISNNKEVQFHPIEEPTTDMMNKTAIDTHFISPKQKSDEENIQQQRESQSSDVNEAIGFQNLIKMSGLSSDHSEQEEGEASQSEIVHREQDQADLCVDEDLSFANFNKFNDGTQSDNLEVIPEDPHQAVNELVEAVTSGSTDETKTFSKLVSFMNKKFQSQLETNKQANLSASQLIKSKTVGFHEQIKESINGGQGQVPTLINQNADQFQMAIQSSQTQQTGLSQIVKLQKQMMVRVKKLRSVPESSHKNETDSDGTERP